MKNKKILLTLGIGGGLVSLGTVLAITLSNQNQTSTNQAHDFEQDKKPIKPEEVKPSKPESTTPEFKPEEVKPSKPESTTPEFKPEEVKPEQESGTQENEVVLDPNKVYEDENGILIKGNGEIVGYKGSSTIIDLSSGKLVDKDSKEKITITSIGNSAFKDKKLTKVVIGSSITKIDNHAFNNTNLSELIFEKDSQLKFIGYSAFQNHRLQKISIPKNVEELKSHAFYTSIKNIPNQTINFNGNDKLTEIEEFVFRGTLLKEVVLPKSVTKIGKYAFGTLNYGHAIIIRGNKSLSYDLDSSFYGYWDKYIDSYTDDGLKVNVFENEQGLIFDKEGRIFKVRDVNSIDNLIIPEKLIDKDTKQEIVPTEIGERLFWYSWRIQSLEIPKTIKKIGRQAFFDAKSLKEFKINLKDGETSNLEEIGDNAFNKAQIQELDLSKTKVKHLNDWIFSFNPLHTIRLPRHAVTIGLKPFDAGFPANVGGQGNPASEVDNTRIKTKLYLSRDMVETTGSQEEHLLDIRDALFDSFKPIENVEFIVYSNK